MLQYSRVAIDLPTQFPNDLQGWVEAMTGVIVPGAVMASQCPAWETTGLSRSL